MSAGQKVMVVAGDVAMRARKRRRDISVKCNGESAERPPTEKVSALTRNDNRGLLSVVSASTDRSSRIQSRIRPFTSVDGQVSNRNCAAETRSPRYRECESTCTPVVGAPHCRRALTRVGRDVIARRFGRKRNVTRLSLSLSLWGIKRWYKRNCSL